MAFKIGFISESDHKSGEVCADPPKQAAPRRSVVQVYFPAKHRTLAYYNDRFDLRQGDLVFVDGKLEGKQGRVEEASYNFRIRLSDYQRVIAVAERGHDYYCRNLVRYICRRNIRGSRKGYGRKSRACHACKRRALSRAYDSLQKSARQSKDRRHRQKYRCCCRRSG